MKKYSIVEDRGNDIKYIIFTGVLDDCELWMALNTKEHPNNPDIRVHFDDEFVNGNGDPFTYTIEEEEED